MNILIFDTETTGIPLWHDPSDDPRQPVIVDIAVDLVTDQQELLESYDAIINHGVEIPDEVAKIHGITTEIAAEQGVEPIEAHDKFMSMVARADLIVGHNVSFDIRMVRMMAARLTGNKWDNVLPTFCTMRRTTNICQIMSAQPRHPKDWKWPKLSEAIRHFFSETFEDAHRARPDCDAARRIYFHLKSLEQI